MFCFNGALPDKSFNCPGREGVCFVFMDRCQTRVLIAQEERLGGHIAELGLAKCAPCVRNKSR